MTKPYISIVIPAYNEALNLDRCLSSVLSQAHSRPFEVIVVDNASDDETSAIALSYGVRVVTEQRKGVCSARQAGLIAARGAIVVSSDADCEYPPGWLTHIESRFERQQDLSALVGTYRFIDAPVPNMLLRAWESLTIRLHYAYGWQWYASAANLAFRRELFAGYDVTLNSGGDELYVVNQLKCKGRVGFDLHNSVLTSARRLRGRFFATLFHDFTIKYIGGYLLARLRNAPQTAAADIREPANKRAAIPYMIAGILIGAIATLALISIVRATVSTVTILPENPATYVAIFAVVMGCFAYITFWPTSQLLLPSPWRARTTDKLVALTFDDGPNEPYTSQIAAIIESYGGKASFMQCGQLVEASPGTTAALSAAGHTIGNHSYDHSFWKLWSPQVLLKDLLRTNQAIQAVTSKQVCFFRSPWLTKNPFVRWAVRQAGLMPIAGRFVSYAEVLQPDGAKMARHYLKNIRPGVIIILHDSRETKGGDRTQTVRAVAELCRILSRDGYRFVSLDELY